MTDFHISNKFTRTVRTTPREFHGVRAYRQSPFNVNLQIFSGTDRQTLIANCGLNADECRALATELSLLADTLKHNPK